MRLQDERYEEIKEIVVTLFENLDISCTPISGFEIAKKLGIIVIPYSATKHCEELTLKYEDAICLEKDDALYIYYNDKKSYERLNWTFLHEIGHLVLGHTEHCELAESEADFFAKFAIAPPVLIHRYKLSTVEDIEDRFQGFFGTKVKLDQGKRKGRIIIEYHNNEDLERMLKLIKEN